MPSGCPADGKTSPVGDTGQLCLVLQDSQQQLRFKIGVWAFYCFNRDYFMINVNILAFSILPFCALAVEPWDGCPLPWAMGRLPFVCMLSHSALLWGYFTFSQRKLGLNYTLWCEISKQVCHTVTWLSSEWYGLSVSNPPPPIRFQGILSSIIKQIPTFHMQMLLWSDFHLWCFIWLAAKLIIWSVWHWWG